MKYTQGGHFYVKIGYFDCEYNYFDRAISFIFLNNLPLSMALETCFFFNSKSCSDFLITEALFWTWATFEAARSIFSQIVVWSTFIVLSCSLPYCGSNEDQTKWKTCLQKIVVLTWIRSYRLLIKSVKCGIFVENLNSLATQLFVARDDEIVFSV